MGRYGISPGVVGVVLGIAVVGAVLTGVGVFALGGTIVVAAGAAAIDAGFFATVFGLVMTVIMAVAGSQTDANTETTTTTTVTTNPDGSTTTTTTTDSSTTDSTTIGPMGPGGEGDEGGGGSACFAAGTLVSTPTGRKPIEGLRPGDMVHAHNLASGSSEPKPIRSVRSARRREIVVISFGKDELRCTPVHRFYTTEWTPASRLRVGDPVRRLDGSTVEITSIRHLRRPTRVYNLVVEDLRSYAVGAKDTIGSSDKGSTGGEGQPA